MTSLLTFDSFLCKRSLIFELLTQLSFNTDSLSPSKFFERDSTEKTENL